MKKKPSPKMQWVAAYWEALVKGRAFSLVRWTKDMLEVQRGKVKETTPTWWNQD